MKKIITLLIGLTLTLPIVASAASFAVTSSTTTYKVGDAITVNVSVNPAPSTNYTAMFDASFSTDTLEVVSFTMNDKMLALRQTGYDALDNSKGLLIKTGGYPGGINSLSPFGTLVLRAKKEGVGTLTVNDNSKLLNANNVDEQIGSQVISFNIEKYVIPQQVKIIPVTPKATTTVIATTTETQNIKASDLLTVNNLLIAIVMLLVIIIGLIVGSFIKIRKGESK